MAYSEHDRECDRAAEKGAVEVERDRLAAELEAAELEKAALRSALHKLFDYFYHSGEKEQWGYGEAADALDRTEGWALAYRRRVEAEAMERAAEMCNKEGADWAADNPNSHEACAILDCVELLRAEAVRLREEA